MARNWNPVDSDSILFGFSLPALKVNGARERRQHDELREGNTSPLGETVASKSRRSRWQAEDKRPGTYAALPERLKALHQASPA
jgi:hypothetical protein